MVRRYETLISEIGVYITKSPADVFSPFTRTSAGDHSHRPAGNAGNVLAQGVPIYKRVADIDDDVGALM